jgi:hypothetical protein
MRIHRVSAKFKRKVELKMLLEMRKEWQKKKIEPNFFNQQLFSEKL